LVRFFLRRAAREGLGEKMIEKAAVERLKQYTWPGNVRELENFVRRVSALHAVESLTYQIVDQEMTETALPDTGDVEANTKDLSELVEHYLNLHFASFGKELPPPGLYDRILRQVEVPLLNAALSATRGNQIRAAELLGVNRNTLRSRIKNLDIRVIKSPAY
ncbi:MAG: nitrogen regulation protein NR(I), partial [Alphaproteobacteria bacterium]|nr:nitrogen regulation protein NR(I) [Alphaproteobacteria bacterium]